LKKTTTPDWMTPKAGKADTNSPEATSPVSEKLGWLMKDAPPGKSFSNVKVDENQPTVSSETEDELVFDVEEEINFD